MARRFRQSDRVVQLSNPRQKLRDLARQQSSVYPHHHDASVTQANRKTKEVLRQLLSEGGAGLCVSEGGAGLCVDE